MIDISKFVGESTHPCGNVAGGSIGSTTIHTGISGKRYFVKEYKGEFGEAKAASEAEGLDELSATGLIRTPNLLGQEGNMIILEFIERGNETGSFHEIFGRNLARLHGCINKDGFGFKENNFIGDTLQQNLPINPVWHEFYITNRLIPQFKLMEKNGYTDSAINKIFDKMLSNIYKIIDNSVVIPSLLHGDLWSGNYFAASTGEPVIFDPAVYYGDRETDIAMTRLFGGFDKKFYSAYNDEFTLEYGAEERISLYQLYHLMNHLNLFGRGYFREVVDIFKKYN